MPIFDVQVKRTHKFSFQVTADDATKAAVAAKQMVKDGNPLAAEYDVKFNVSAAAVDPDTLPSIPGV